MMESMTARATLIERIASLSEDDFARVAPYIEADLEAAPDFDALLTAINEGRLSARIDPLHDDVDVRREARAVIRKP
jgi:hypothetical protein